MTQTYPFTACHAGLLSTAFAQATNVSHLSAGCTSCHRCRDGTTPTVSDTRASMSFMRIANLSWAESPAYVAPARSSGRRLQPAACDRCVSTQYRETFFTVLHGLASMVSRLVRTSRHAGFSVL